MSVSKIIEQCLEAEAEGEGLEFLRRENQRIQRQANVFMEQLVALREENRRLLDVVKLVRPELHCMSKQLISCGYREGKSVRDAKAAIEAVLQPATPRTGGEG